MHDPKNPCGPPIDIVKTEGVRVARCPCGTIHMTFQRTGVTVQLAADYFAEVVEALSLTKTILEPAHASNSREQSSPVAGRFVTIETDGFKKPTN